MLLSLEINGMIIILHKYKSGITKMLEGNNQKKKKSKFQKELEKVVSRRIVLTILVGCLFFSIAMLGINMMSQQLNRERHLNDLSSTFYETYNATADFLQDENHYRNFLQCIEGKKSGDEIRYLISKYNVDACVGIHVILSDTEGNRIMSNFSKEDLNLHRQEFDHIACKNAKDNGNQIYNTVYYFSGDTSEYVFVIPLFENNKYVGSISAYLKGMDWNKCFSKEQYDTIITNENHAIIYCSNTSFLTERNANKYKDTDNSNYIYTNDRRYLLGKRVLKDRNIILYSFIYSPKNYLYMLIGVVTIVVLGCIWTIMFLKMLGIMAGKTSESVSSLVKEIRIIRKEDVSHEITVHTGDEIEEIASQINKMVKSIHELNHKNLELLQINSRMEMQNLQEQMNPHFIYNTLDNIRYLIVPEPAKAEELITRFTHILRYSINNTLKKVSLQEDLKYIEDYLVIQKTRFGERFSYAVKMQEKCLRAFVPKLLLQPLLENSIKYGFRKKPNISLKIESYVQENYLYLIVEDDGAGQPKSTMEILRAMIQKEEIDTTHNGLQNISRRVKLEYGKESGMSLESIEGEYFKVILKIWMGDC